MKGEERRQNFSLAFGLSPIRLIETSDSSDASGLSEKMDFMLLVVAFTAKTAKHPLASFSLFYTGNGSAASCSSRRLLMISSTCAMPKGLLRQRNAPLESDSSTSSEPA
jgi:hypothetical protein